jgi:hypothetical protein
MHKLIALVVLILGLASIGAVRSGAAGGHDRFRPLL